MSVNFINQHQLVIKVIGDSTKKYRAVYGPELVKL
jgi:hypothetical protein